MSASSLVQAQTDAQWTEAAEACYQAGDDPARGVELCTEAIDAGGLTSEFLAITYSNRGNSYFDLSDYELAVADYNAAIALAPDDAVALSNRGAALMELEFYGRALSDLNRALVMNPDNAAALTNRCWVYAVRERYELALADCSEALRLEPLDPISLASRSYVRLELEDEEGARADAELAVRFGEDLWQTHFYLGMSFERAGDLDAAVVHYARAAEMAPDEARVREKLAELGVQ